ncbi:MAG: universal stress protein [Bdellovibrionales bacterium]
MKSIIFPKDINIQSAADRRRQKIAFSWTQFMSKKMKCPLQSVSVVETSYTFLGSDGTMKPFSNLKLGINRKAKANSLVLFGSPVEELSKLTRSDKYQMITMATHGRKGISRILQGSVVEEVIRHSDIPVFVLGPKVQEKNMPTASKKLKLLVATDLAKGGRSAEEFAIQFAKKTGAGLVLLHCPFQGKDPMIQIALGTPEGQKAVADLFKNLHKSALDKMRRRQKKIQAMGIHCEMFLEEGFVFAERAVAKTIKEQKPDLVITGTNARTLVGQAYFGSTARQTILQSPIPVIVVKSRRA